MNKILIVEDDNRICNILEDYLLENNYECKIIMDGIDVMESFTKFEPDLLILDLMLPNLDGYKICQLIRTISDLPIIILTAKGEEIDKLKGYKLGADDYITKPFSPNILMAKIKALLRRSETKNLPDILNLGVINLNISKREVFVSGNLINLTYKEFEVLKLFMENPGHVFSREHLLDVIWGYEFYGGTRTVDTHIKTLRKKLGLAGSYIVTMIRTGYKFEEKDL